MHFLSTIATDARQYLKLCLSREVPLRTFFTVARLDDTYEILAAISRFQDYIRRDTVPGRVYRSWKLEDEDVEAISGYCICVVTTDPCYLFRTENGQVFIACRNRADRDYCVLFTPERPVAIRPPGIYFNITK